MDSVFIHVDVPGREKKDKNPPSAETSRNNPPAAHLAQDKTPFSSVEKGLKYFFLW